ncbi:MAG TPA: hypothetical protein VLG44_03655, partial [Chlamydiales bacterium]|nr:hypothetical protein [Chlamydiales bacterium]
EDFYISYGNWRTEYPENFRCFSLIKRITEISAQSGGYLSDQEEQGLIQGLDEIKNGLYSGNLKHTQIPSSMSQIVLDLAAKNSKAKLIAHVIELEYFLQEREEKWPDQAFGLIQKVIAKVTPHLSEMNAHAAAKEMAILLAKLVKDPCRQTEILHTLETTLKHYL